MSIRRFLRPVCYQNMPTLMLPTDMMSHWNLFVYETSMLLLMYSFSNHNVVSIRLDILETSYATVIFPRPIKHKSNLFIS
jgi:hypothetical protein